MLKVPAPFPQVGSYGLFIDPDLPIGEQRAELVRVQWRMMTGEAALDAPPKVTSQVGIAFPLRSGASGSRTVDDADLQDATPLTREEQRELVDLQRQIAGRDRPNPEKLARSKALRTRLILSDLLRIELDKLDQLHARDRRRQGTSNGTPIGAAA